MARSQRRGWLATVALGLLSGCVGNVSSMVAELDDRQAAVELQHVPFHSQITDQCGPAALAMTLNDSGVAVSPEELRSRVYIPGRQGALQVELLAAARHFGRVPYEIDTSLLALVTELDAGRPVLVLQNLGAALAPIWHYAVVVGYLPEQQELVLRSGDRERLLLDAKRFARTWQRGDSWGVVMLEPGELPANPDAGRYLRAVAAVEATNPPSIAIPSYRAATRQWPQNSLAWLGLGNVLYSQGELQDAEQAYRKVLAIDTGDAVAMNNLAQVYVDQGCSDEALTTIEAALSIVAEKDPVRAHLLRTRQDILRREPKSSCR
jgi:tetratricopeptide (TPR) repeat protein